MLIKDVFRGIKCPNCGDYHDATLKKCPNCNKDNQLYQIRRVPKRVVFLHPFAQLGMFLVGFAYGGMLIAELIAAILTPADMFADKTLRSTVVMVSVYGFMFVSLLVIAIFSGRRKMFLGKFTNGIDYLYGIGYAITIIVVSLLVGAIVTIFHESADNVNQTNVEMSVLNYPLLSMATLCVIGPICEELTYRVGLYSFLRRFNKYFAFAITVVVFALIHFEFTAKNIVNELWSLPSYLAAGFVLTLAYEHRGPACSMTAHIIYNSIALAMVFLRK